MARKYWIAALSGIIFGYVAVMSMALIVANALSEGPPITAISIWHPVLWLLIIPACTGAILPLVVLASVGYTRPTTMIGIAAGALVGMFVPVLFADQIRLAFIYALATIISEFLFGWVGSLGGNMISKIFGRFGVDGKGGYWEDWD